MAQRVACIVLVGLHDWAQRPSIEAFVDLVKISGVHGTSEISIKKTVSAMVDWGHRYANMERLLGKGISLSLGSDLPESQ